MFSFLKNQSVNIIVMLGAFFFAFLITPDWLLFVILDTDVSRKCVQIYNPKNIYRFLRFLVFNLVIFHT